MPRPRRGRLEAYGAALEMRFGETRRGFESPPLRHRPRSCLTGRSWRSSIAAGRARWGTSGALHPQSATAGLNPRSRPTSLRLPRDRPTLRVGSHAAKVREPRQVRKEAAVSERLRVPWGDLAGAGRSSRVCGLSFDAGCTAYSSTLAPAASGGRFFARFAPVDSQAAFSGLGVSQAHGSCSVLTRAGSQRTDTSQFLG
jgi:hypothetical protein